ncbi:MAG: hypothetical protein CME06_17490 [Gemmatimonadetes bacterium]|nr:hypothetical protein [Gemmatimonadota bacterium]
MILLLFGTARAGIQPVRTINFLENQGFEVTYQPYLGIFQCTGNPAPPTAHVVHWWGNKPPIPPDTGFNYYPVIKKGVNQTDQIEFERLEDPDNVVIHFRDVRDMGDGNYLTYRRSPDSCPSAAYLEHLIEPNQWQPSDIKVSFRAKGGSAAAVLTISVAVSSEYRQPGDESGDWIIHLEEVGLSASWDDYTITVPNNTMTIKTIEPRFGLDPDVNQISEEAWLDNVKLTDQLMWIATDGEGEAVTIHPEGQLLVGNDEENLEPFFVAGIQDRFFWAEESDALTVLRDRCQALGFGPGGAEFNTLLRPPSQYSFYRTKREAHLVLDAAQTAGMKVILWLPLYPSGDHETSLPMVPGLVKEWIDEFDNHPALLGWTYGDEKTYTQIENANHTLIAVLDNYERSIEELEAKFRPVFLFTSDGVFGEDNPQEPGEWAEYCVPGGCLEMLYGAAHVVMPNWYPITAFGSRPNDVVSMLSQWCWSKGMHHYVNGLLYPPSPEDDHVKIERAVLPVVQLRPSNRSTRPPWGWEPWIMGAQAAGGHGLGYMAVSVGIAGLEHGANVPDDPLPPLGWDLLDPQNRAGWDAAFHGQASQIFDTFPWINRMGKAIGEKRFEGDPSFASLPPKVVTRAWDKPSSGQWEVEDSWIAPGNGSDNSGDAQLLTGFPCHNPEAGCSGFGRLEFKEMHGEFDAARTEEANLLLTVEQRVWSLYDYPFCKIDNPDHCCDSPPCGYNTPFTHVSRIPNADTLTWAHSGNWEDFFNSDDAPPLEPNVFHHFWNKGAPDEERHPDFGLQFLASGRRDYGAVSGMPGLPIPSHRIVDFDLTNVVRYWSSGSDGTRNNGLFVQPYAPTRRLEPHLVYESSEAEVDDAPSRLHPSILVYEMPVGKAPKELGAPFTIFYEGPPGVIRVFELAHLAGQNNESWLLAINSDNVDQCLRIYSNRHPVPEPEEDPPTIDLILPALDLLTETIPATTSDAEFVDFNPEGAWPIHCPDPLTFGLYDHRFSIDQPWHPDPAGVESYQPITRWDLSLPAANQQSAVLIRVPHPTTP